MYSEKYKDSNKLIKPSTKLIQQTKKNMLNAIDAENNQGREKEKKNFKYYRLAIVAVLVLFVGSINISPTFAATLEKVPVVGQLVQVLSFRTYSESDEDKTITIKQPIVGDIITKNESTEEEEITKIPKNKEIQENIEKQEHSEKQENINKEIEKAIAEYTKDAEIRIDEYKEAFIATGGTEEGFAGKDIQVVVDYEINIQTDEYLSFTLTMYEDWNSNYAEINYYNLDAKTGEQVEISDLLGKDYIQVANEIILSQITKSNESNEFPLYFSLEENGFGGFETISETPQFYINENENAVIVFDKYEVAPGSTGRPEFEIIL